MFSAMSSFTQLHVLISLIGILSGLVVLYGFVTAQWLPWWNQVFVWTTVATTLTGFLFPFNGFTPAIGTGIVSTLALILLLVALYVKKQLGAWRKVYVITAVVSLYLNVFVLIVQLFQKVPALHALAPQGKEPPFAIAQGVALLFFITMGVLAVTRYHPEPGIRMA